MYAPSYRWRAPGSTPAATSPISLLPGEDRIVQFVRTGVSGGRPESQRTDAFALENEDEFIKFMLEEIPVPALYAARIRATNLGLEPA